MSKEPKKNQQFSISFGGSSPLSGRDTSISTSNNTTFNIWISVILALAIGGGIAYFSVRHQQSGFEVEMEKRSETTPESQVTD